MIAFPSRRHVGTIPGSWSGAAACHEVVPQSTVRRYLGVPRARGGVMGEATTDPVRLPPAPRIPKVLAGVAFVGGRVKFASRVRERYGPAFTINLPIFGPTVVISEPALIKDLFAMGTELTCRVSNLADILGPGSTFSLDADEHRDRRKLLAPPFHGKRMRDYERLVEEEVMSEIAGWPEGEEFQTLPPMVRITLNVMLRAVFGAEGAALDELRELLPPAKALASRMTMLPGSARRDFGRWSPWGRFLEFPRR